MRDKIKSLGTDTAIYGVSTILGRFLTFILTPLYTHVLLPDALGVVALGYTYIAFLNVVYGYGMESAYFRYAASTEMGTAKQNFSVPFISLGTSSLVFSLLLVWQAKSVALLVDIPETYLSVVYYAAGILFLDTLVIVPYARLRLARKTIRFATIRIINILVNVGCNILLLFTFRMGVEGIFLSGLISSAVTLLFMLPVIIEHWSWSFPKNLYKELLRFGLPYVPAGVATMMIQVVDRPILEAMTNVSTVGIYQVNYRLGIFMMLIVSTFDFAWRPFFLSHATDPDAKRLFARILTYFVLLMVSVFLVLSFFLEDIVRIPLFAGHSIIDAKYWSGLSIVPVVLLAYVFLGISNNLVAGIYIEKKTKHLPMITFIGVVVNIGVNVLLIPILGIMGAAVATLASYSIMALVLYLVVQRFYPVSYELGRLGKIAVCAGLVYGLQYLIIPVGWEVPGKILLLIVFLLLMYAMNFFNASELRTITGLLRRKQKEDISPLPPSANDL